MTTSYIVGTVLLFYCIVAVIGYPVLFAVTRKWGIVNTALLSAYAALGTAFSGWIITSVMLGAQVAVPMIPLVVDLILGVAASFGFAFWIFRDAYSTDARKTLRLWAIYVSATIPISAAILAGLTALFPR